MKFLVVNCMVIAGRSSCDKGGRVCRAGLDVWQQVLSSAARWQVSAPANHPKLILSWITV